MSSDTMMTCPIPRLALVWPFYPALLKAFSPKPRPCQSGGIPARQQGCFLPTSADFRRKFAHIERLREVERQKERAEATQPMQESPCAPDGGRDMLDRVADGVLKGVAEMECQRHESTGKIPSPLCALRRFRRRFCRLAITPTLVMLVASPVLAAGFPAPKLDFTPLQLDLAQTVRHDLNLAAFYGGNGLQPIFTGPESAPRRAALTAAIAKAAEHGLPASRYDAVSGAGTTSLQDELTHAATFARWIEDLTAGLVDPRRIVPQIKRRPEGRDIALALAELAAAPDPLAAIMDMAPRDPFYLALKAALAADPIQAIPEGTPLAPSGVWRPGMRSPGLADLRARLAAAGFDPGEGPADLYDDGLAAAVTRFQQQAGLVADGIAGPQSIARLNGGASDHRQAILIAMERWRWLPEDLGRRHVWVNLAEYATRVVQDGEVVFETRSVIGKAVPDLETPEFSGAMEYLVFNPAWNVPRSIIVNEYLPKLRANPNAVAHIDIIDRNGRVVPRGQIDFSAHTAASFPYRMREKPSPGNAMGQVKFLFPNEWNIYLHDTPARWLFDQSRRAHSHGCIRIQRPLELAETLLDGQTPDPGAAIRNALARPGEQWLRLDPVLPVHLVYFTTIPGPDGRLRHLPDIYGRDAPLWQALADAGLGA